MANYIGRARSNYFHVKDQEAFTALMVQYSIEVHPKSDDLTLIALFCDGTDSGGWPSNHYDEDQDEFVDFNIAAVVAEHLIEGDVAIFEEIGWEKSRYLVGYAVAVNSAGETRKVDIGDVFEQAKQLGPNLTPTAY